jgi:putative zinc finger protein
MTLECRHVDERLLDFVYDELPPEDRAEVAAHVEACGRCAAEVRSMTGTRAALRALPDEEPSAAATTRILHEAARPRTVMAKLRALLATFALHPGWSLGAATAVVLVVSLVLFREAERAQPPAMQPARNVVQHEELRGAPAPPAPEGLRQLLPTPAPAPSPPAPAARPEAASAARAAGSKSRKRSQPFVGMEKERDQAKDILLEAASSTGRGAGAAAPPEPTAAVAPRAAEAKSEPAAKTASSPEVLRRNADRRRERGDCPGAVELYEVLLNRYPYYPHRADVDRAIAVCRRQPPPPAAAAPALPKNP